MTISPQRIDPRARAMAKARQDMAGRSSSINPGWDDLPEQSKQVLIGEAAEWLQAAVEGEYQTSPPSYGDAVLRLVWESDECSSKEELEAQGVEFRLIGWSQ